MRFAQFFRASALSPKQLVECVGGDSVAKLDSRHALQTSALIARSLCKVRGFSGFDIREGQSYSRAIIVRKMEKVTP
jgi:hypothetical protein